MIQVGESKKLEESKTNIRNRQSDLATHAIFFDYLSDWLDLADKNLHDTNQRFASLTTLLEDTTKTSADDKALFNAALLAEAGIVITWNDITLVTIITKRDTLFWARTFIASKVSHIIV